MQFKMQQLQAEMAKLQQEIAADEHKDAIQHQSDLQKAAIKAQTDLEKNDADNRTEKEIAGMKIMSEHVSDVISTVNEVVGKTKRTRTKKSNKGGNGHEKGQ